MPKTRIRVMLKRYQTRTIVSLIKNAALTIPQIQHRTTKPEITQENITVNNVARGIYYMSEENSVYAGARAATQIYIHKSILIAIMSTLIT